jgi:hypothetical protein
MLAAERLAEIAGLAAAELVEVVLLELADSGATINAQLPRKRAIVQTPARRAPAEIISLDEVRRRRGAGPEDGAESAAVPSGGARPRRRIHPPGPAGD